MNKMRALIDFESTDGSFKKDETFHVNDERAFVLTRLGQAERAPAEPVEQQELSSEDVTPVGLGVPKHNE